MRRAHVLVVELDELHTILAALRHWQRSGYADPDNRPLDLHEIAVPDEDITSPDDEGIDRLCERLNCGSLEVFATTDGLDLIRYVRSTMSAGTSQPPRKGEFSLHWSRKKAND